MIDPIDDLTRPLPVATASPIRLQFASPLKTHTVVLMQDLLEQWVILQSWVGRNDGGSGGKSKHCDSLEEGLSTLEALGRKLRKQGCSQLAS